MISRRTMRTVLLGLSLAGATAMTVVQPARAADEPVSKPPPATNGEGHGQTAFLDHFKAVVDALKLSDADQKKVDALFAAARKDLLALDQTADGGDAKKKAHDVLEKLRKDVSGVLTNEQKMAIATKLKGLGTSVVIDKIKEQLSKPEMKLTDDQKKKVDDVLDDTRHRLEELRAEGGKDVRNKLKDILQDMSEKLKKILSPDDAKDGAAPKPDTSPKSGTKDPNEK